MSETMTKTLILLSSRKGTTAKEGSNKNRPYVSYKMLDSGGSYYDFFCWNDSRNGSGSLYPDSLATPCLVECELLIGSNSEGKGTVDLHSVNRYSASFGFGKIMESLKLPMEKVPR
ncbi:MAG: hypothetical protein LBB36_04585 [Fibromonadaceae bacterium]|jgi:hypothetical protein|nr:hypothetical protein [Fibromonadaceae bacterium]